MIHNFFWPRLLPPLIPEMNKVQLLEFRILNHYYSTKEKYLSCKMFSKWRKEDMRANNCKPVKNRCRARQKLSLVILLTGKQIYVICSIPFIVAMEYYFLRK